MSNDEINQHIKNLRKKIMHAKASCANEQEFNMKMLKMGARLEMELATELVSRQMKTAQKENKLTQFLKYLRGEI